MYFLLHFTFIYFMRLLMIFNTKECFGFQEVFSYFHLLSGQEEVGDSYRYSLKVKTETEVFLL